MLPEVSCRCCLRYRVCEEALATVRASVSGSFFSPSNTCMGELFTLCGQDSKSTSLTSKQSETDIAAVQKDVAAILDLTTKPSILMERSAMAMYHTLSVRCDAPCACCLCVEACERFGLNQSLVLNDLRMSSLVRCLWLASSVTFLTPIECPVALDLVAPALASATVHMQEKLSKVSDACVVGEACADVGSLADFAKALGGALSMFSVVRSNGISLDSPAVLAAMRQMSMYASRAACRKPSVVEQVPKFSEVCVGVFGGECHGLLQLFVLVLEPYQGW